MAEPKKQYTIDDLLKMPGMSADEMAAQFDPQVVQGDALDPKVAIKAYNNKAMPDEASFVQKNYNDLLEYQQGVEDANADLIAKKQTEASADQSAMDKYYAQLKSRAEQKFEYEKPKSLFDQEKYNQDLQAQMSELDNTKSSDMASQFIYALGPGLLGALSGTQAGKLAASDAGKISRELSKESAAQSQKDRALRIDAIQKKIAAAAEMRKADQDAQKNAFEEAKFGASNSTDNFKNALEAMKYKSGKSADALKEALKSKEDLAKERVTATSKGIDKTADVMGKSLDRIDKDSKEAAKESKDAKKEQMAANRASSSLRQEFQKRDIVIDFNTVEQSYNKMLAAASKPSGVGDMALMFGFMKILDPGSAVKEGEYANAEKAGSIPQNVWRMYNKILDGEKLPPELRAKFIEQGKLLVGAAALKYKDVEDEFGSLSDQYGIDRSLIFTPRADKFLKPQKKQMQEPGQIAPKPQLTTEQQKASDDAKRAEIFKLQNLRK
jgi:hypothetical protein